MLNQTAFIENFKIFQVKEFACLTAAGAVSFSLTISPDRHLKTFHQGKHSRIRSEERRVGKSVDLASRSRRRHTRFSRDWSSDVCSSDLKSGRFDDHLK